MRRQSSDLSDSRLARSGRSGLGGATGAAQLTGSCPPCVQGKSSHWLEEQDRTNNNAGLMKADKLNADLSSLLLPHK